MAISRDTGAAFPLVDGFIDLNIASRTSATFSTNNPCVFVVCVAWRNNGNNAVPYTVSWNGGTPANATGWTQKVIANCTGLAVNIIACSIWTASSTTALSNVAVTVAVSAADAGQVASLSIDALNNALVTGTNTGNVASASGSAVNRFITLAGVTSGSWLYAAYSADDSGGALTTQTNTTTARTDRPGANAMQTAVGYNSAGGSGSISVGWTGTQTFAATCALEILAGAVLLTLPSASIKGKGTAAGSTLFFPGVLDFGYHPGTNEASLVITGQTAILGTSHVEAWIQNEPNATLSAADQGWASQSISLTCGNIVPGVGFTIYGRCLDNMQGKFKVRWFWI
jgi:hypothetical protein